MQFVAFFRFLRQVLSGAIDADLPSALGSTTVVAITDRDGIIAEPYYVPEAILLMSEEGLVDLHLHSAPNTPHRIGFDDSDWSEKYLACVAVFFDYRLTEFASALKPLGLNCLLNNNCHHSRTWHKAEPFLSAIGLKTHGNPESGCDRACNSYRFDMSHCYQHACVD